MNIPHFEDAKHIGRRNCAKFAWKNAHGPDFPFNLIVKRWFQRKKNMYENNQAFRDLIDASLTIVLFCAMVVAIYGVTLYLYYRK